MSIIIDSFSRALFSRSILALFTLVEVAPPSNKFQLKLIPPERPVFVETATKVFTPRTFAEMSTNEPRILFHFLVEVFGNQTAIMTAGMSAFHLPDIRVPYTRKTSRAAQAAAFGIAAQMVCDGFKPTIGGFFKNTESAPVFSTRKVKPPGHENPLGCWELKIT